MKKYYVNFGDFSNNYNLCSVETELDKKVLNENAKGWERISRKFAEKLAAAERLRRKTNPSFAYYADSTILPAAERLF